MSNLASVKDLVEVYAKEHAIPKTVAKHRISSVLTCMSDVIKDRDGITVPGIFTIQKKVVKGREGTCAFNGKKWKSEDRVSLKISTGKKLLEELNS